jgi:hypothetical protein
MRIAVAAIAGAPGRSGYDLCLFGLGKQGGPPRTIAARSKSHGLSIADGFSGVVRG